MSRERSGRPAAARGYTMLEVMMSLAVLAIGVLGVVATQHVTLRANFNARAVSTANAIATGWVERLRADGVQWNDPDTGPDLVGDTRFLNRAITTPGVWFEPQSVSPFGSSQAAVDGTEIYGGGASAFCTHLRLTQVLPTLVRAEVRVFWRRDMSVLADCSGQDPSAVDTQYDTLGFVHVVTGVFHNTSPN